MKSRNALTGIRRDFPMRMKASLLLPINSYTVVRDTPSAAAASTGVSRRGSTWPHMVLALGGGLSEVQLLHDTVSGLTRRRRMPHTSGESRT
jgi:hypothetical protein